MSRGLLIGAGVLGGGALLALAFRERVAIEGAIETVYERAGGMMTTPPPTMVQLVKRGVTTVTDAARAVWKSLRLPTEAEQNIVKYQIGDLVDKYRGPVPKWMALAIIHTETGGTFDPNIYNHKVDGKYKAARWVPGTPFPTDSWAHGLFQILRKYTRDNVPKGKVGYDVDLKDVFDPGQNVYAGLKELQKKWDKYVPAAASDADKLAMLYFSHNQGGGALDKGLKATSNKLNARDVITAAGAGMAGAPLSVALATASRGKLWSQLGDLKDVLG